MTLPKTRTIGGAIACGVLLLSTTSFAWEPNARDRDAAIKAGNITPYFVKLTAWLDQKVPESVGDISEKSLQPLLQDRAFAAALAERRLLKTGGVENFDKFAKADPENAKFLSWLLSKGDLLDETLIAQIPSAWHWRNDDSQHVNLGHLENWEQIYYADSTSRKGLYLKLAAACAIAPPGSINQGAGYAKKHGTVLDRYMHYRKAHAEGDLMPSFDTLNIWELKHVVSAGASDLDLAWGREALNTWNPGFRNNENVVGMVGQVWRRGSQVPYNDMSLVMAGGGKCGPRSAFGVFINQAFGIPSIGVGQPAHAAITFRKTNGDWQIAQGRGFHVSKILGMPGNAFLEVVEDRRSGKFSAVEHLRWLAASIESPGTGPYVVPDYIMRRTGVRGVVPEDRYENARARAVYFTYKALPPFPEKPMVAQVAPVVTSKPEAPIKVAPGVIHVEAEDFFTKSHNLGVNDCYTGGKQVYYPALTDHAFAGYKITVPKTGHYRFTARVATVNWGQVLYVRSFGAMYQAKAVTASDVYRSQDIHSADKAADHDLGTRWAMNFGKDAGWIELDLGRPREISKLIIDERALGRVSKYRVKYKSGDEWKLLFEGDNFRHHFAEDGTIYTHLLQKEFPPVTAQYVRLNPLDTDNATGGPTIWDFSVGNVFDGSGFIQIPWAPSSSKEEGAAISGRWQTTKPMDMYLVKGEQNIFVCAQTIPGQRSVAMRWFELTPEGR